MNYLPPVILAFCTTCAIFFWIYLIVDFSLKGKLWNILSLYLSF
jgi:hypothetical protein